MHNGSLNSKFRFILVKNQEKSVKNRFLRARNRHFGPFSTPKNQFFDDFWWFLAKINLNLLFGTVSGNFSRSLSCFRRYRKFFENFLLPFSHLPTLCLDAKNTTTKQLLKNFQNYKINKILYHDNLQNPTQKITHITQNYFKNSKFLAAFAYSIFSQSERKFNKILLDRYKVVNAYFMFLKDCGCFVEFVLRVVGTQHSKSKTTLTKISTNDDSLTRNVDVTSTEKLLNEFKNKYLSKEFIFLWATKMQNFGTWSRKDDVKKRL